LRINTISHKISNSSLLELEGRSGLSTVGFVSQPLNYTGRYVSLMLANATIFPTDSQISFVIDVKGIHRSYHLILVHGALPIEGWSNYSFFKAINSFSSILIDLPRFITSIGDQYSSVKSIGIIVQGNTTVNPLYFRIDLKRTTENTPVRLPGGNLFSVIGNVSDGLNVLKGTRYIFNNWNLHSLIDLEMSEKSGNDKLVENGWNVLDIQKLKNNKTNTSTALLRAYRPIAADHLPLATILLNFDSYYTLMHLGPKDLLFLVVIISAPLLLYYRRNRPQKYE
jgi:hypothetical protein